jgi:cytochrome P450 family 142 subfamily A polypeptide 1
MPDHPTHPDIDLMAGEFYAGDPHPLFAWMRTNAPLYWDEPRQVWGVTLHEDIQRVSRDPGTFCNRHGMRPDSPPIPSMINYDDPLHKKRRGLVNRGFTKGRIADQEAKVRRVCRELIAGVASRGECEFVRDVAAPLPMIMIGDMLGVAPEDRDDLLRWSDDLIDGTSATASPEAAARAGAAFGEYAAYNRKVVADRRSRAAGDDLMSILVHAEIDGDRLDDEALLQESLLILVGGDETTRHVITGGMLQLLRNPEQRDALVADPSRIPIAVEEMLRWVTPIQNMARTATRDVELRGQQVREGDKLLLLYPSGNRDATVFSEPDRFDAGRDPNPHLAFGGYGTHFCLGSSLEELLRWLPDMALATEEVPPMRPSNFITGIQRMPVTFTPTAVSD